MVASVILFAAALTGFTAESVTAPASEGPAIAIEMPAIEVIERRGFDPLTGAGSSIDVQAARSRLVDAGELLGHEVGVTVRQSGSVFQTISIRGTASNQAQLFINGVPLPSSIAGQLSPAIFPLDALERIDVYRGSTPARFARSPLGGAINIITRDPETSKSGIRLAAGSFSTYEGSLYGTAVTRQTRLTLGAGGTKSEGDFHYLNDNGTFGNFTDDRAMERQNNDAASANGFTVFSINSGRGILRGHLVASGYNQGLAGFGFDPAKVSRFDSRIFAGGAEYILPHGLSETGISVFAGHLRERFRDPRGELSYAQANILSLTDQAGVRIAETCDVGAWRPEIVLEGETLRFRAQKEATTEPYFRRQRVTLVAGNQFRKGQWLVIGTAQTEYDKLGADNLKSFSGTFGQVKKEQWLPSARLGIAYLIHPNFRLLSNAGTGNRTPTAQEQFGNRGTQIGNLRLKPEQGVMGDVGIQWERKSRKAVWLVDVRYYRQVIKDIIGVYQTSPKTSSAVNFERAEITGYEALGKLKLFDLSVGVNGVYQSSLNMAPIASYRRKQLPGRPRWEIGADASYDMPFVIPFYQMDAKGGYFLDPVNTRAREIESRFYHNLGLTVRPINDLRMTASVNNVTDVRSFDFVGLPLPGRSYALTAQLNLN